MPIHEFHCRACDSHFETLVQAHKRFYDTNPKP